MAKKGTLSLLHVPTFYDSSFILFLWPIIPSVSIEENSARVLLVYAIYQLSTERTFDRHVILGPDT